MFAIISGVISALGIVIHFSVYYGWWKERNLNAINGKNTLLQFWEVFKKLSG